MTRPACPTSRPRQRGLAAIEFAAIAMVMVMILLGLLVYWRAFQVQQSLTRAAGDGGRALLGLATAGTAPPCHPTRAATYRALIQQHVERTVRSSLELSALPGEVGTGLRIGAIDWSAACPSSGMGTARFELTYELPPLLGTGFGEPRQLAELGEVHFSPMR